jgi:hypothetical protein
MNEILEGHAVQAASQSHAAQWAARAGTAFALEKRKIDAEYALIQLEGQAKTELVNALRSLGQQLRP